ncbi:thioredoxin-like protein [Ochromonadaceae sp. CCMP2298]|nr:thioredoxin-like protein [Ochromonadaceae sp. CCMP2298]
MPVTEIVSKAAFDTARASGGKSVFFFWASWHEPSAVGGQMQGVFAALSEKYPALQFFTVEAEAVPEVSEDAEVAVVPTFVASAGGAVVGKVEGANPAELSKLVKQLASAATPQVRTLSDEEKAAQLNARVLKLIKTAPVMLFMKGNPADPKCGFSRQIVALLKEQSVPFASFDILLDEEVRQALKTFSDWPTYPQLYVNGELAGGLDIVKELCAAGILKEQLGVPELQLPPAPQPIEERLRALILQAPVVAFIKGSPDAPKCGFSRTLCQILAEHAVPFASFNILGDEEVRAALKTYSDWPTYPQLYVNGELAGGLDIVKEMVEAGDLKEQLGILMVP